MNKGPDRNDKSPSVRTLPSDHVAAAIVSDRTTAKLYDHLSQRLKTHQASIARLERHTHATVRTLQRIAAA